MCRQISTLFYRRCKPAKHQEFVKKMDFFKNYILYSMVGYVITRQTIICPKNLLNMYAAMPLK